MNIKDNLPQLFIILIVAFSFLLVINHAKAEENKITKWLVNEKNEIIQFQKDSWQDSKVQFTSRKIKFKICYLLGIKMKLETCLSKSHRF